MSSFGLIFVGVVGGVGDIVSVGFVGSLGLFDVIL